MAADLRTSKTSSGARFYKCALQVNPDHYSETFRGQPAQGDALAFAKEVVDAALEQSVEVLAITDHNSVADVPVFRAAAKGTTVHILPGFELSSREGVHVLCIYPPETNEDQLDRYLGEFGIRDPDPSSDPADKSLADLLRLVRSQGGVAIAAHATNDSGLLKVLGGQARVRAWKDQNLLAVQIPGSIKDLPHRYRLIVENQNPEYRRSPAPAGEPGIAVVNAKDVASPEDLVNPAATCSIKMDAVGVEGLRQAFLDPGSRILLAPVETEGHTELLELNWKGGFLDGERIQLNPNLNVLIGGRGTGKSTIVESVRSVLGLEPVGNDARKAHEGIARHVLRGGTKISLRVRVPRPAPREYTIERTLPNPPLVRDQSGEVSHLAPSDLVPRIEVYGQNEISELARSEEKLTSLLDRFVQADDTLATRKASLRQELKENRRVLLEKRREIESTGETLAELPMLEETLQRFREAGLEERLQDQTLLVREERILDSAVRRLAPFREALDALKRESPLDRAFLSEEALADLPAKELLAGANQVLLALDRDLERVAQALEKALERANEGIGEVKTDWEVRKLKVERSYARILRDLQRSSVDGEEFMRLRRQIERLRPLREQLARLGRVREERWTQRVGLLAEWEELKAGQFRDLDRAARKVNALLKGTVRVAVVAGGNREPLFSLLRNGVGGRISEAIERLKSLPELSLAELAETCRAGTAALVSTYSFTPAQATRFAEASADLHMRIEELELPPTTTIRLNTASADDPPEWRALDELSKGQKATAVLLLLLLESDAPLVVDQPEDDLDNRFITEGVVPRMREEKQRRQFIFSTHNANIPVLGDAELILGLSAAGEADGGRARIAPEHRGSIDSRPVRELVEEILEGGKAAFETRRRKYGF